MVEIYSEIFKSAVVFAVPSNFPNVIGFVSPWNVNLMPIVSYFPSICFIYELRSEDTIRFFIYELISEDIRVIIYECISVDAYRVLKQDRIYVLISFKSKLFIANKYAKSSAVLGHS